MSGCVIKRGNIYYIVLSLCSYKDTNGKYKQKQKWISVSASKEEANSLLDKINNDLSIYQQNINKEKLDTTDISIRRNNGLYRIKQSIYNAIKRAKINNLPYDNADILLDYILQNYTGVCKCCGVEFKNNYNNKVKSTADNAFSIDRVIPEKGYIIGNIDQLCVRCNRIKSNADSNELMKVTLYTLKKELESLKNNKSA